MHRLTEQLRGDCARSTVQTALELEAATRPRQSTTTDHIRTHRRRRPARIKVMTLTPDEFMHRFVIHVLLDRCFRQMRAGPRSDISSSPAKYRILAVVRRPT